MHQPAKDTRKPACKTKKTYWLCVEAVCKLTICTQNAFCCSCLNHTGDCRQTAESVPCRRVLEKFKTTSSEKMNWCSSEIACWNKYLAVLNMRLKWRWRHYGFSRSGHLVIRDVIMLLMCWCRDSGYCLGKVWMIFGIVCCENSVTRWIDWFVLVGKGK